MPIDPYVVHRDDMGMIEPCHRLRLEQEPPTDLVGALGQDLDGDFAFEHVVDATKDLGYTAFTDSLNDTVPVGQTESTSILESAGMALLILSAGAHPGAQRRAGSREAAQARRGARDRRRRLAAWHVAPVPESRNASKRKRDLGPRARRW